MTLVTHKIVRSLAGLADSFANSAITFLAGAFVARTLIVEQAADYFLLQNWALIALGLARALYVVPLRKQISSASAAGIETLLVSAVSVALVVAVLGGTGALSALPLVVLAIGMFTVVLKDLVRARLLLMKREVWSAVLAVACLLTMLAVFFSFGPSKPFGIDNLVLFVVLAGAAPYLVWGVWNGSTRLNVGWSEFRRAVSFGKWLVFASFAYAASDMMLPTIIKTTLSDGHLVFYAGVLSLSSVVSPAYRYFFLRNLGEASAPTPRALVASTVAHAAILAAITFTYSSVYPAETNFGVGLMSLVVLATYLQNVNVLFDAFMNAHDRQQQIFVNLAISITASLPLLISGMVWRSPELLFAFPGLRSFLTLALNYYACRTILDGPSLAGKQPAND